MRNTIIRAVAAFILCFSAAQGAEGDLIILREGNGTSSSNRTTAPYLPVTLGGTGSGNGTGALGNLGADSRYVKLNGNNSLNGTFSLTANVSAISGNGAMTITNTATNTGLGAPSSLRLNVGSGGIALSATSDHLAVAGTATDVGTGVSGSAENGTGVRGQSTDGNAISAQTTNGVGVRSQVYGTGNMAEFWTAFERRAHIDNTGTFYGLNGVLGGNLTVNGTLTTTGFGNATATRSQLSINATNTPATPGGTISANTTQAYLEELRDEKAQITGNNSLTGNNTIRVADGSYVPFTLSSPSIGRSAAGDTGFFFGHRQIGLALSTFNYVTFQDSGDGTIVLSGATSNGKPFLVSAGILTVAGNATVNGNFSHGDAATDEFTTTDDDPTAPNLTTSTFNTANSDSVLVNRGVGDGRYGIPNLGDGIVAATQPSVSVNGTYDMNTASVNKTITSLTRNGTTATAVSTAHGFTTGMTPTISGASPDGFNGEHAITVVDANTFTYVMDADPGANATGTIIARNHWVRLFEGTTGNMISGEVTISVSAAGSRDTVNFSVGGVSQSNGIGITRLGGSGWTWMYYVRVSQSGTTTRLEAHMRDPTRSYGITANWTPRAGTAPAAAFLGGSPGPYSTKQRIMATSADTMSPIFTVNPPSIAANSYGEVGTGNDILLRPILTSGLKMQPIAISNCIDSLPTGLIFVDVRVASLGQIVWRFYNATGSPIDAGDLRMATRAFYTVTNL